MSSKRPSGDLKHDMDTNQRAHSVLQLNLTLALKNETNISDQLLTPYEIQEKAIDGLGAHYLTSHIIALYVNGVISLAGFIGNTLTLYVLHQDKIKTSNTIYLQALAVFDIFFLICTLVYPTLMWISTNTLKRSWFQAMYPFIIAYALPVEWIARTGVIWLTTAAVSDRYQAIVNPLKVMCCSSLSRAKRTTTIISITAVIFNVPRFLYYNKVADNATSLLTYSRQEIDYWYSDVYFYLYDTCLTSTALYIIPLTCLIIFNFKMVKTLKTAAVHSTKGRRQSVSELHRVNFHVTPHLVIQIVKFFICQTPELVTCLIMALRRKDDVTYRLLAMVAHTLLVVFSSVNFYVSLWFNQRFRRNLCCADAYNGYRERLSEYNVLTKTPRRTASDCIISMTAIGGITPDCSDLMKYRDRVQTV